MPRFLRWTALFMLAAGIACFAMAVWRTCAVYQQFAAIGMLHQLGLGVIAKMTLIFALPGAGLIVGAITCLRLARAITPRWPQGAQAFPVETVPPAQ